MNVTLRSAGLLMPLVPEQVVIETDEISCGPQGSSEHCLPPVCLSSDLAKLCYPAKSW